MATSYSVFEDTWKSSVSRTAAILKATALTLQQHPRLLWFPVLAVAGSVAVLVGALVLLAVFAAILHDPATIGLIAAGVFDEGELVIRSQGLIGLLALYAIQVVTIFTGVALTHASMEALSGREWSIEGSLEHAHSRIEQILGYAVAAWLAGIVLGRRRKRGRGLGLRKLLRFTWRAVTYLVLPVISREGRGAVEAIQRSSGLVKETWREGVVGHLSLRWAWAPIALLVVLPIVLCGLLEVEHPLVIVGVLCTSVSVASIAGLFLYTVEVIFRSALYIFATEGVVPEAYDCEELHCVWRVKSEAVDTSATAAEAGADAEAVADADAQADAELRADAEQADAEEHAEAQADAEPEPEAAPGPEAPGA